MKAKTGWNKIPDLSFFPKCERCDGKGEVLVDIYHGGDHERGESAHTEATWLKCPWCQGLKVKSKMCPSCEGAKRFHRVCASCGHEKDEDCLVCRGKGVIATGKAERGINNGVE